MEKIILESYGEFCNEGKANKSLVKRYLDKFGDKMKGSTVQTTEDWVKGIAGLTDATRDEILKQIKAKYDLKEAKRSVVHKAAKKGSYPAVIVVIQDGKVIHQEPVPTPEVAPATFNVMQEEYPKAIIHLEDATGQRLFSESVNEAKEQLPKKGAEVWMRLGDKNRWQMGIFIEKTKYGFKCYQQMVEKPEYIDYFGEMTTKDPHGSKFEILSIPNFERVYPDKKGNIKESVNEGADEKDVQKIVGDVFAMQVGDDVNVKPDDVKEVKELVKKLEKAGYETFLADSTTIIVSK